jgi:DNA-directed RNA polymerase subunit delta
MDDLNSKLGYLRGLADGLGINDETKEGKVIQQMIALLDEIGRSLEELKGDYEELFSYVEAIDQDLTELEDELLEDDDDDDYDDDDYDDYNDDDYDDDDDDDDDEESAFDDTDVSFTVECPECHQEVIIDEDILEDEESFEVLCPTCGRVVFINDDEEWENDLDEFEDEKTEENKTN